MKAFLKKALLRNNSKLFLQANWFLAVVTLISILVISLETVTSLKQYEYVFLLIEYIAVVIFTLEFIARLYAKENKKEYLFSLYGLIDILSILPTYIGLSNLTFLKTARIFRVLSFLRMSRLAKLARLNKHSNRNSKGAREIQFISVKIYVIILVLAIFSFGSLLYTLESESALFKDIPTALLTVAQILFGSSIATQSLSPITIMVIVCVQFFSMLLFGLLIAIIGQYAERRLLGSSSLAN